MDYYKGDFGYEQPCILLGGSLQTPPQVSLTAAILSVRSPGECLGGNAVYILSGCNQSGY